MQSASTGTATPDLSKQQQQPQQPPHKRQNTAMSRSASAMTVNTSSSSSSSCSEEKTTTRIEQEMNIYLNSNKVFFDAHGFFPSFESIEHTLCNNLKSQCISSSDHGYLCLVSMMKQQQTSTSRHSCALVAPFILRNSKALNYIMIQLNGIDLILDMLVSHSSSSASASASAYAHQSPSACVKKILSFVGYKRNTTDPRAYYESRRLQVQANQYPTTSSSTIIRFVFDDERDLLVDAAHLLNKSAYFSALLFSGNFAESSSSSSSTSSIRMKDVSFEVFSILVTLIAGGGGAGHQHQHQQQQLITFDACHDLIVSLDRFCLLEWRDLFIALLVVEFMSLSTWLACLRLAWHLNSAYLANAALDYLFSLFQQFPLTKSAFVRLLAPPPPPPPTPPQQQTTPDDQLTEQLVHFSDVLDYLIQAMQTNDNPHQQQQHDKELLHFFRQVFKGGLTEIIKCNYWKLY